MLDVGEPPAGLVVAVAALDSERALPDLGKHQRRRQDLGDLGFETEPLEGHGRDDDGVVIGRLLESREDVAAQSGEREIRANVRQLRPAPSRPCCDQGARGEVGERAAHQRVTGVPPLWDRGQHQSVERL